MPNDTENHTLRLLREMREENQTFHDEMRAFRQDTGERLDSLEAAVSGLAYIVVQGQGEFQALEARVERLENKLGLSGEPAE